ncbi:MAG: hypothetical protein LAT63_13765 [Marinobacter sp.]|nr:hypothetical protein [Marinobacter sp.]
MPQQDKNSERYIAIARACLRAINDSSSSKSSQQEKIQAVYEAIDKAFQAEFQDYRQALLVMTTVLEKIASGELTAEATASLAKKTLNQYEHLKPASAVH